MYRLVVLCFTLFAVGDVSSLPIYTHLPPAAISHQSRVDIIESTPVLHETLTHLPESDIEGISVSSHSLHQIHETPLVLPLDAVHNSEEIYSILSPEDHLPELHNLHQIHDTPLVVPLESVHHSEEIHSILSSEDHLPAELHSFYGIHEAPTSDEVHNSEEILSILSPEDHISESDVHAIPIVLYNSEEIHSGVSSEHHEEPIFNVLPIQV